MAIVAVMTGRRVLNSIRAASGMRLPNPFIEQPASVGETYLQHCRHSAIFGWTMFKGSLACFVHALCPFAHTARGSTTVRRLYNRMVLNRRRANAIEAPPDDSRFLAEGI